MVKEVSFCTASRAFYKPRHTYPTFAHHVWRTLNQVTNIRTPPALATKVTVLHASAIFADRALHARSSPSQSMRLLACVDVDGMARASRALEPTGALNQEAGVRVRAEEMAIYAFLIIIWTILFVYLHAATILAGLPTLTLDVVAWVNCSLWIRSTSAAAEEEAFSTPSVLAWQIYLHTLTINAAWAFPTLLMLAAGGRRADTAAFHTNLITRAQDVVTGAGPFHDSQDGRVLASLTVEGEVHPRAQLRPRTEWRPVSLSKDILTPIKGSTRTGNNASGWGTDCREARIKDWNTLMLNTCEPIITRNPLTCAGSFLHGNSTSIAGLAFEGVVSPWAVRHEPAEAWVIDGWEYLS